MIVLNPFAISALTGGAGADSAWPIANLLGDNPNLFFQTATTSTTSTTIVVTTTSDVDSVCLLRCWASTATITVGGSAPAGLTTTAISDAYYSGAKAYWWRFNRCTGPTTFTITLTRVAGEPLLRASVVKLGQTWNFTGVQFPVEESYVDPTPEVPLMDGFIFRGVEIPPYRTFSANVLSTRANIHSLFDLCRVIGGLATFWYIEPAMLDYFFLYGRLAGAPTVSHAYPTLSYASLGLREIM